MDQQKFIDQFLEEYRDTISDSFNNEEQLLKNSNYKAFAEGQIKKATNICWAISPAMIFAFVWGIINLIQFGETSNWTVLAFGLTCLALFIFTTIFATRELISIKTSMRILLLAHNLPKDKE